MSGLLLLVSGWRRLLATITALTLAHPVTLALALGGLPLPPAPVQALIALSIVIVACEVIVSGGRLGLPGSVRPSQGPCRR